LDAAVQVENLTEKYGTLIAVRDVSFSIEKGEIFGLLGPNSAGKTTTVEMIEGLRKQDTDALEGCGRIKEIIGVQLQTTTLYYKIWVGEVISVFWSCHRKSLSVHQVLEEVSLTDKKSAFVSTLSGGQKQRLAMALALVDDPVVLFLDEPTTGLDPQARHNVWSIIEEMRERGKTIILTTHYMEEAKYLCHRVGVIDRGRIIALDTPFNLIAKAGLVSTIEFTSSQNVENILDRLRGNKQYSP
jgi:ABC-2 type transport system ATP-binding protein